MSHGEGAPENVGELQAEVLALFAQHPGQRITWQDLEERELGGRCPWKRLGELEAAGDLTVVGRVKGRYGRQVKVYLRSTDVSGGSK